MGLRAVFLDIGDTVIRPNPSWEHFYAEVLREHGVEASIDDLYTALRRAYHHGGWGLAEGFEPTEETTFQRTVALDRSAFAELGIGPLDESFFRDLSDRFLRAETWLVFGDALPAIDALHARGLVVGAVSNWVWQLPELLETLGIAQHFDFLAVSARIGYEKPNPKIFEYALQQASVAPDEALQVGDHLDADVQGALAVGIGAVLIDRWGRYEPAQLPPDVPHIRSLSELVPLVDARLESEEEIQRSA